VPDRPARPPRPQTVLTVLRTERLSPSLVRVHAGGPGFATFTPNAWTDAYVKIVFVKPELGLEPPYDLAGLRERLAPEDLPVTRTYTVRSVDPEAGSLAIDFVVHGDRGLAGPWAASAAPGDRLVFSGPGGGYAPDDTADWHLFVGDESAVPAVSAALAALPADAVGVALLEVHGPDHEVAVDAPDGVEIRWLHRDGAEAGTTSLLVDTLAELPWRGGRVQVFAHGEREAMKAVRDELLVRRRVPRGDLSLSGYWAFGRTEDRFQAEKREPVGVVL